MRFVAISDTHTSQPDLPEGDVLLHTGDLTYRGNLPEVTRAASWLEEQKKKYRHVIVIAGNHDWLFQKEPSLVSAPAQALSGINEGYPLTKGHYRV
ncbi:MAG: hypothetical protein A2V88_10370 [Elusimicrobia bacterium RBG_16_66_12]|nr:MAG: hypothetical protein A2V88_10370 [Elusimicrobia bacterium RBG_16_66_12]